MLILSSTISAYTKQLSSFDLDDFNSNIVDPIKLLFDKNVFSKSYEEIINLEIHRQKDKSNSNIIGYFHQKMFAHIENCIVPPTGWDIVFTNSKGIKINVELKNKYNTMNSSSAKSTFIRMQNEIINDSECICCLVEVIAPISRNIEWQICLEGSKMSNDRIRRVSIDKFYELVTGDPHAFYKICRQLPDTIESLIQKNPSLIIEPDTVLEDLSEIHNDTLLALYKLAFKTYEGFSLIK